MAAGDEILQSRLRSTLQPVRRNSDEVEAEKKYRDIFKEAVEESNFTPGQIFNMDETGIQWKLMPKSTYMCKLTEVGIFISFRFWTYLYI